MAINKLFLEPDGLVVGTTQLVASGGGITVGQNLAIGGDHYVAGNISLTGNLILAGTTRSLNINGNLVLNNYLNAGGSVGTNGQVLQATGTGVTWANPSSGAQILNTTSNVAILGPGSSVNVTIASTTTAIFSSTGLIPGSSNVYALGSTTAWWSKLFSVAATAQYADLAEIYTTDQQYPSGTVMIFGGESEVTQSHSPHDTRIAGVVSTNPAYLMNGSAVGVPIALQGRVPCRVLGPVEKGDRLVSSHIPGIAQKLDPQNYHPGCIIGKSLEDMYSADIGIIEVVVGRL